LLVNFAELADHVVNEYEKCVLDLPIGAESKSETARFSKKSESGTIRLIRTTSKCLARDADDKSGCSVRVYKWQNLLLISFQKIMKMFF
jgi:hypothetical protein